MASPSSADRVAKWPISASSTAILRPAECVKHGKNPRTRHTPRQLGACPSRTSTVQNKRSDFSKPNYLRQLERAVVLKPPPSSFPSQFLPRPFAGHGAGCPQIAVVHGDQHSPARTKKILAKCFDAPGVPAF